jgi:hypothetical protein
MLFTMLSNSGCTFRTVFVFVTIELGSRRVVSCGVTRSATDAWLDARLFRYSRGLPLM